MVEEVPSGLSLSTNLKHMIHQKEGLYDLKEVIISQCQMTLIMEKRQDSVFVSKIYLNAFLVQNLNELHIF